MGNEPWWNDPKPGSKQPKITQDMRDVMRIAQEGQLRPMYIEFPDYESYAKWCRKNGEEPLPLEKLEEECDG